MRATYRKVLEEHGSSAFKGSLAVGAALLAGPAVVDMAFTMQQSTPIYDGAVAAGMALAGFLTLGSGFDNAVLKPVSALRKTFQARQKESDYRRWMRSDAFVRDKMRMGLERAQDEKDIEEIALEYVDGLVEGGKLEGYDERVLCGILGDNDLGVIAKDNPIREARRKAKREGRSAEQLVLERAEEIAMRRSEYLESCGKLGKNTNGKPIITRMPDEHWTGWVESRGIAVGCYQLPLSSFAREKLAEIPPEHLRAARVCGGFMFMRLWDPVRNVVNDIRCVEEGSISGADGIYLDCHMDAAKLIGRGRKLEPVINAVADRMFINNDCGVEGAMIEYGEYLEDIRLSRGKQKPSGIRAATSRSKFLRRTFIEPAKLGGWLDRIREQIEAPPQLDPANGRARHKMPWMKRLIYKEFYDFLDLGIMDYINTRDTESEIAVWLDTRPRYLKIFPLRTAYNALYLPFRLATFIFENVGIVVKVTLWDDRLGKLKDRIGMRKEKVEPTGRLGSMIESRPSYMGSMSENLVRAPAAWAARGAYNLGSKYLWNYITALGAAYIVMNYAIDPLVSFTGAEYWLKDAIYFAGGAGVYYCKPFERLSSAFTKQPKAAVPVDESGDGS